MIPTVFGAVSLVFFAMQIAPGDPVTLFLPPQMPGGADPELVAAIRKEHGFDRPLYEQYWTYLGRMARLDFGRSLRQDTDVAEDLKRRIANTFQLGFASLVVAGVLGITLGTVSAIWRGSGIDNASMVMALLGVSLPSFWIAMMLIVAFGLFLPILPPSGYGGPVYTQEGVRYAILPIVTLGLAGAAALRATPGPRCSRFSARITSAPRGQRAFESRSLFLDTRCATRSCRSSPSSV